MSYDPDKHDRRSLRLRGYDYTQAGAYFITICAHDRGCLFGEVDEGRMYVNAYGRIVAAEWQRSRDIRVEITLDAFVVMPNHMHGVVLITPPDGYGEERDVRGYNIRAVRPSAPVVGATGRSPLPDEYDPGPPPKSLGAMVAGFKAAATRRINQLRQAPGEPVWQRGYYDRILRGEGEWRRTRRYIRQNPARWHDDRNHPTRL